jgi:hypothetical protein
MAAVRSDLRDRHDQMEVAAELVIFFMSAATKARPLGVGQIDVRDGRARVLDEAGAEIAVLLQLVEQGVDRVAAL